MHRIFGKPKAEAAPAPPPPSLGDHITKLEGRVPELDKKVAECDAQLVAIKQQLAKTRPAAQGPLKQRALQILKRKQMYDQQRGQMQTRAFNLEQTQFAIDGMAEARSHVDVMRTGVAQMKAAAKDLDLGEIEDIQDDMIDMLADTEELNEMLGRSYDSYNSVSEADLDSALADLDGELSAPASAMPAAAVAGGAGASSVDAELAALSVAPAPATASYSYPSVPTGVVSAPASAAAARPAAAGGMRF